MSLTTRILPGNATEIILAVTAMALFNQKGQVFIYNRERKGEH